jgi:glycosyltransferase involved in cell wall biosynthesis
MKKYAMTILIIHNSHRSGSSSGDDVVFKKEAELLKKHGHRVVCFNISNDEFDDSGILKKIFLGLQIPWSVVFYRQIKRILKKVKPDIVHIHNFFPLLSPSIYHAIKSEGIPLVQTLHDFRFLCPMAFFMKDGSICVECREFGPIRSIRYGCFKNSKIQTIPVVLMLKLHYRLNTFKEKIDAYICLTEFQRSIFVNAGFDENKFFVKPNFIDDTYKAEPTIQDEYVAFIGRIGEEKGLETLINAWKYLKDVPLKLVGDGPDADKFKALIQKMKINNIDSIGYRPHDECMNILNSARFLVMPSVCYETFGLTIVEAFSHCKPVIASNLGAMADIVKNGETGLLFKPKDADDLAEKVRWLWNNHEECRKMGLNARSEYEAKYTPERNYEMLMDIYEEVLKRRK